jgi:cysteine desulfurase/selenocysteine lyase
VAEPPRPDGTDAQLAVRQDFPILGEIVHGHPLTYLDNAATTQKPLAVLRALVDYYSTTNCNIGRGHYDLSMKATDRYEAAREVVREWLNAAHDDEIVFTRGTTDAMNLLAGTLGARLVGAADQILITGMEHNSNFLPWRRLCEQVGAQLVVVPTDEEGRVPASHVAAAFDANPRIRLAAVAHVSNVLGAVAPVAGIVAEAHRRGIVVVVDGAQAAPHRRVDVRALDADFYCFSGHKVYGPMGTGVLYGRRDLLHDLPPYQVGGGTVKGVTYTDPVAYVPVPARMEAGTPDVAGAVGLAAALDYVSGLGWDTVRAHDETLVRTAVEALTEVPKVRVVGDPAEEPSGIVSFVVDGLHPYDVGGHLNEHGIAVRSGVHCASTFLDRLGLVGTVRMSFGVYNTVTEIERVRDALRTVSAGSWTRDHPTTRFL